MVHLEPLILLSAGPFLPSTPMVFSSPQLPPTPDKLSPSLAGQEEMGDPKRGPRETAPSLEVASGVDPRSHCVWPAGRYLTPLQLPVWDGVLSPCFPPWEPNGGTRTGGDEGCDPTPGAPVSLGSTDRSQIKQVSDGEDTRMGLRTFTVPSNSEVF